MTTPMTKPCFTVTYMWPGAFVNETQSIEIPEGTMEAALAVMPDTTSHGRHAFGFEITETAQKRFVSDDGEERWLAIGGSRKVGRWYFGEMFTLEDVATLNLYSGGKYDVLIDNMRSNNWSTVVHTITDNFQPVENGDTVLPASQHPYLFEGAP